MGDNRPAVVQITDPTAPDLLQAVHLLSRRLPANERDEPQTIVRWVKECREEHEAGTGRLRDYCLVAKLHNRVIGFCYSQYYIRAELLFVSYLITDDQVREGRDGRVAAALVDKLQTELREGTLKQCRGVVFEVDDPRESSGEVERLGREARIRLFQTLSTARNLGVKVVDVPYVQPALDIWSPGFSEEPLCLMYARTRGGSLQNTLSKGEVRGLLKFIYHEVYGDHFEHDRRRDRKYRAYVDRLYRRVLAALSGRVQLRESPMMRRRANAKLPRTTAKHGPVSGFCSYSHRDERLRRELEISLTMLERNGLIKIWYDCALKAGEEWSPEIASKLQQSRIVLLLVSADFIASNYAYAIEMKTALKRARKGECRIVPIIVRDVTWQTAPFARFQVLPPKGKPVTLWRDRDSAWRAVAEGIEKVLASI